MITIRKNKLKSSEIKGFYIRSGFIFLCLTVSIILQSACYLHSDEQETLAEDIQSRYNLIQPAGDVALQKLDDDLNQLLAAQRTNTDLLTETSETATVEKPWSQLIDSADKIEKTLNQKSADIGTQVTSINKKQAELKKQKDQLEKALQTTNTALEKLQKKKTLEERLKETKEIINATTNSINNLIPNAEGDPFNTRLKNSIDEIVKYLNDLDNKEIKTEKTYSLLLESLRLGRDIITLQIEAIETEENYSQRLISLYDAETQLLRQRIFIGQYKYEFNKYAGTNEKMAQTIHRLSEDATKSDASEENLRNLLENVGKFQTLQITVDSRLSDLDLRLKVEEYRRARLLDAVYERQRMVLVSTGLDGIVRYSKGGWRSEDIGRITSIIGTIAQIVIAVRVK